MDYDIYEAIKAGDCEKLQKLIAGIADINAAVLDSGDGTIFSHETTPVYLAARYGQVECLKILIESGADVNAVDEYEYTAAHSAAMYGQLEYLKVLIENGVNVNAINRFGRTAAQVAIINGEIECAELLKTLNL